MPWIEEVQLRGLAALSLFAEYSKRLDMGESTVLAWAEIHQSTAVVDEKAGRQMARDRGVAYRGSLWIIAEGIRRGLLTMTEAAELIDELQVVGMYLPCKGANFPAWAHQNGLLEPGVDSPEGSTDSEPRLDRS